MIFSTFIKLFIHGLLVIVLETVVFEYDYPA